jgi:hypothetical protein
MRLEHIKQAINEIEMLQKQINAYTRYEYPATNVYTSNRARRVYGALISSMDTDEPSIMIESDGDGWIITTIDWMTYKVSYKWGGNESFGLYVDAIADLIEAGALPNWIDDYDAEVM